MKKDEIWKELTLINPETWRTTMLVEVIKYKKIKLVNPYKLLTPMKTSNHSITTTQHKQTETMKAWLPMTFCLSKILTFLMNKSRTMKRNKKKKYQKESQNHQKLTCLMESP